MPVVTFGSLKKKEEEASEEERGGNEYYTGGTNAQGGGSGLAVLAPSSNDGPPEGMAQSLRAAMALGTQQREQGAAGGSGRRVATVAVFMDGFTVDDGPLRRAGVPENDAFIRSLGEGYCPQELVKDGEPADVRLENRATEKYPGESAGSSSRRAPNPSYVAFAGEGNRVGGAASSASSGNGESSGFVIVAGMETKGVSGPEAGKGTIRVQIKYPDGTKEVVKFEAHHTVRNLMARIESKGGLTAYEMWASPGVGAPTTIGESAFDLTLTQAGLASATVQVKDVSGE